MGARRVVLHDRRARPSAVLSWQADGSLAEATVRLPDHSWIVIDPRAGVEAPWGAVDRLRHGATPLTVMTAVDWNHVASIPTVVEPSRIPAGGGTALLNLLATLACEQGVPRVVYDGPYPSEALFLALLESFRPEPDDEPLARFVHGELTWTPAPFTPSFDEAIYVQARGRVEKVVWRGRAYYREDWGAVRRRAHLRVHDVDDAVHCSLWALGEPLEDHLVLDGDGTLRALVAPPGTGGPAAPLRPAIRDGIVAMVVALSAPPLAESIRAVCASLAFTCGPVDAELAAVDAAEVRVSTTLARAIARRLGAAAPSSGRGELALAALAEIGRAIGDALRARAQRRLAAASAHAQAAALAQETADPAAAQVITAAVGDLLGSGRVDDQPDVERDEAGDRDD